MKVFSGAKELKTHQFNLKNMCKIKSKEKEAFTKKGIRLHFAINVQISFFYTKQGKNSQHQNQKEKQWTRWCEKSFATLVYCSVYIEKTAVSSGKSNNWWTVKLMNFSSCFERLLVFQTNQTSRALRLCKTLQLMMCFQKLTCFSIFVTTLRDLNAKPKSKICRKENLILWFRLIFEA